MNFDIFNLEVYLSETWIIHQNVRLSIKGSETSILNFEDFSKSHYLTFFNISQEGKIQNICNRQNSLLMWGSQ